MPAEGKTKLVSRQIPLYNSGGEKKEMFAQEPSGVRTVRTTLPRQPFDPIKVMSETAGTVALAGALNLIKIFYLPQGGSVTLASMVPVFLLALRRGWKVGISGGVILGLVVLVEEPYVVHPAQLLLDYPIAYGALGLSGFFRKQPLIGVAVGIAGRFMAHFVSGVIFFASFAGSLDPFTYSAVYNGSYLIPELLISAVAVVLLVRLKALELYL